MSVHTLSALAERFGLELRGDGTTAVSGVCTLSPGRAGCIGFLANTKYRDQLAATAAAAVIVGPRDAAALATPGLVARDPYLAYARIAALFDRSREFPPDVIHPSAVVGAGVTLGKGCCIGPNAVIAEGATLGDGVFVGPNCVIGQHAVIGSGSMLAANVYIWQGARIGARCSFQPGAVIGGRGFGNARGPQGWEEVPQLGSVVLGDDVEVGANTCIDRGAIEDTVIGRGVRLDNLIQIAHNCQIGEHTAIAACTGVAGSTRIGARCMIGGAVGIAGHVEIGDDVVVLAMAMVTKSLPSKGVYGSGLPVENARDWRKSIARMRRLDRTESRLREIEQRLGIAPGRQDDGDQDGNDD